MGRKSSISRLEPDIKAYIQARLAEDRLTLDELIADLRAQYPAAAEASALPSRASLGRYRLKLDARLSAIRASTEAAKIIRAEVGDREDARSEALIAMIQSELFESIMNLQEASAEDMDPADRVDLLSKAGKNIATLSRASIAVKKFQAEAVAAIRRELLAEQDKNLQEIAKAQGMDAAQVDFWRRKFLGIAA